MKAVDIRSFFKKKRNEDNEVQARLEEVEEELSLVADNFSKSKVNWHAS